MYMHDLYKKKKMYMHEDVGYMHVDLWALDKRFMNWKYANIESDDSF